MAWSCASVSDINAGLDDQTITEFAQSLRNFGHPVFLRWFWEMNLKIGKHASCLGSAGPAGFVAAWQRVWRIFHQVGATNVALVWCPDIQGGVSSMSPFFPGASYVDWIAVDGYDWYRTGSLTFAGIFTHWYSAYAGYGKPLMIAETGALAADQAAYLTDIQSSLPSEFPQIKAVVYFDAPGTAADWVLTPTGLLALRQLSGDSYFQART